MTTQMRKTLMCFCLMCGVLHQQRRREVWPFPPHRNLTRIWKVRVGQCVTISSGFNFQFKKSSSSVTLTTTPICSMSIRPGVSKLWVGERQPEATRGSATPSVRGPVGLSPLSDGEGHASWRRSEDQLVLCVVGKGVPKTQEPTISGSVT